VTSCILFFICIFVSQMFGQVVLSHRLTIWLVDLNSPEREIVRHFLFPERKVVMFRVGMESREFFKTNCLT
ncbi:hypothetical protein PPACK8108_LOCUS11046, partial [Phakopsora pachyrhizi]